MIDQELERLEAKLDSRLPDLKASRQLENKIIKGSNSSNRQIDGFGDPSQTIKLLRDQNTECLSKDFADLARLLHRIGFTESSITMIYDELLLINKKKVEVIKHDWVKDR